MQFIQELRRIRAEQAGIFFLLKITTGSPVCYKNLVVLPPPFHKHLADRKALQLAEGKLGKEEAMCPTRDPSGTLCESQADVAGSRLVTYTLDHPLSQSAFKTFARQTSRHPVA